MQDQSVTLIDHDQLFAAALSALLEEEGFQIDGYFSTLGAALADLTVGGEPDLIIIDPVGLASRAAQPGAQPLDRAKILQDIRAGAPGAALVVLTSDMSDAAINDSLAADAQAHLAKGGSFGAMRRALLLVSLGQSVFPNRTMGLLADGGTAGAIDATHDLSPRETQILSCLLAGLPNKAIARRLQITESTVKMHFKNVLRKIHAANRTQAAVWAIDHGITPMV